MQGWKKWAWRTHYLLYAVIVLYLIVNFYDVSFPVLNPSENPPTVLWTLTYPFAICPGICRYDNSTIQLYLEITANGTIAENVPVGIEAQGTVGAANANSISLVSIGFVGAQDRSSDSGYSLTLGGGYGGVSLVPGAAGELSSQTTTVVFAIEGDYSPTLIITYSDSATPVEYTYSDYHIHVDSAQAIATDREDKEILVLTLAAVMIALIDGRSLAEYLREEGTPKIRVVPTRARLESATEGARFFAWSIINDGETICEELKVAVKIEQIGYQDIMIHGDSTPKNEFRLGYEYKANTSPLLFRPLLGWSPLTENPRSSHGMYYDLKGLEWDKEYLVSVVSWFKNSGYVTSSFKLKMGTTSSPQLDLLPT